MDSPDKPRSKPSFEIMCHRCHVVFRVIEQWYNVDMNTGKTHFKNGHIPWNKGTKGLMPIPWHKGKTKRDFPQLSHSGNRTGIGSWPIGKKHTLEARRKIKEARAKQIITKEHIRNALRRRSMSSLEVRVDNLIQQHNLPYKFVGNGKFFIDKINPDFVNINGEKKMVEVYFKRHKDQFRDGGTEGWKRKRSEVVSQYGWEVIFLDGFLNDEKIISSLKGGV